MAGMERAASRCVLKLFVNANRGNFATVEVFSRNLKVTWNKLRETVMSGTEDVQFIQ